MKDKMSLPRALRPCVAVTLLLQATTAGRDRDDSARAPTAALEVYSTAMATPRRYQVEFRRRIFNRSNLLAPNAKEPSDPIERLIVEVISQGLSAMRYDEIESVVVDAISEKRQEDVLHVVWNVAVEDSAGRQLIRNLDDGTQILRVPGTEIRLDAKSRSAYVTNDNTVDAMPIMRQLFQPMPVGSADCIATTRGRLVGWLEPGTLKQPTASSSFLSVSTNAPFSLADHDISVFEFAAPFPSAMLGAYRRVGATVGCYSRWKYCERSVEGGVWLESGVSILWQKDRVALTWFKILDSRLLPASHFPNITVPPETELFDARGSSIDRYEPRERDGWPPFLKEILNGGAPRSVGASKEDAK